MTFSKHVAQKLGSKNIYCISVMAKILQEISCRKILRENLTGNSCRKILQEILAGKSCGKFLVLDADWLSLNHPICKFM